MYNRGLSISWSLHSASDSKCGYFCTELKETKLHFTKQGPPHVSKARISFSFSLPRAPDPLYLSL